MGESMAIFTEDIYELEKAAYIEDCEANNFKDYKNAPGYSSLTSAYNKKMQQQNTRPNNNMVPNFTYTGSGPAMSNAALSELQSLIYAHVGQRLMFANENNNNPVPAMHYQYVTSSGMVMERPGSPMIQQAFLQQQQQQQQQQQRQLLINSMEGYPGYGTGPAFPYTQRPQERTYVNSPHENVGDYPYRQMYGSPSLTFGQGQSPQCSYQQRVPSPSSIHKDLLLPPDATDAEVERNLSSRVQSSFNVADDGPQRSQVLSPEAVYTPTIPGIFLSQTDNAQSLQNRGIYVTSNLVTYTSQTPPISELYRPPHHLPPTGALNPDAHTQTQDGETNGKMQVTDLDQDLDIDHNDRSGEYQNQRAESPVPDLIDDTRSGQPVQQISVITSLPDLLKENNADCMRRVVPKIREVLYVAGPDMQQAACQSFLQTLQQKLVPVASYTTTFLQSIITALNNKDQDIANAWLETLLDVIDLLSKEVIKKEILTVAVSKGQLSQSVQSRLTCCKILGKIATKFEPFTIKKDILPVVQSLCQDVDYEVRACMCRQLDPVARGLGLDQTKGTILPELLELTNDEESLVRLAGIETVVKILTLLDDETRTSTIIPLVCKFCQQSLYKEDITLPFVAHEIGKLAHELQSNLSEEQRRWFIDYYKKLCRLGVKDSERVNNRDQDSDHLPPNAHNEDDVDQTVETRKNAAFNFPAMVLFVGSKQFKSELYQTLNALVNDPHYSVRKAIGMGLHEVAKALHNNCFIIINDFMTLLKDDSLEVFQGIVTYLPDTLDTYVKCLQTCSSNVDSKHAVLHNDFVSALLHCEAVISSSNNWRLQALFFEKLSCLPSAYSSDLIYHKFVPLLFKKLVKARALPVKHAAGRTLIVLARHTERLDQREEICSKIIEDLCNARSCYLRCLFVDVCAMIMDTFSKTFFKEYFFEFLLRLSKDVVPNVRLKLCRLFPRLKKQIKLPKDRHLLQQLEASVRKLLMSEKDKDTLDVLDSAVKEFDKIQVLAESASKRSTTEEDILDEQKEEFEKNLILREEKEKEDDAKHNKSDRKKDASNKKESQSKPPAPKRGSKTPAATSITKPTAISAGGVQTERSGSFSGADKKSPVSNKTRSTRANNMTSPAPTVGTSTRKGSASSVASGSSLAPPTSGPGFRRSSTGTSPNPDIVRKNSASSRRISTGSMAANGSASANKKK